MISLRYDAEGRRPPMADRAQIDELVAKMTEERERLLGELEAMSEERASTPFKDGEWNQKQQMSHLCEMETAYRAWVEAGLEEDDADVDGMRGERPAIRLEEANDHTLAEHVAELRRQRDKTMQLINGMKPEEFERRARNSIFGSL